MPHERCAYFPRCVRPAVVRPVVRVPVLNWPHPAFLQLRWGVCDLHQMAFSLGHFTDYWKAWYDMIRAELEEYKRPVRDPVTGIVTIVKGNYQPADLWQCRVEFWPLEKTGPRAAPLWRNR